MTWNFNLSATRATDLRDSSLLKNRYTSAGENTEISFQSTSVLQGLKSSLNLILTLTTLI